ncbi:hypothetical protein KDA_51410 [Dictyobacter alpinus]|uniref:VOC domain-containing protein n=1 Tax=Dictyobacter alpinus TaxID=2014873 RepID=A0A402BEH6_9CHLR|nr:VOC family protein [Dictyobacter alpinus]GCE29657.1 hypothetical protein KDA_51410 [Dictyobacter alpinus]
MAGNESISTSDRTSLKSLDNIGIAVHNLPRMYHFYTEVLGLQSPPLTPDATAFFAQLGAAKFVVFQTDSAEKGLSRSIPQFMHNPAGYDHLVFTVDDIDAAGDALEAKGVRFEVIATLDLPEGGQARVRRFKDPEGNLIGLQQVL